MKPRLLLADDHTLVLEALGAILRPEFDVVGTVTDGGAAVAAACRLIPDLLLLEFDLPVLGGLEVVRALQVRAPRVRCMFVTQHTDRRWAHAAHAAGARGCVSKDASPTELLEAVGTVVSGGTLVGARPSVPSGIRRTRPPTTLAGSGELTVRQREVLTRVATGMASKQIASDLGISLKTVEFHKACISRQLGLRTTAAMTRYAVVHGLAPTTRGA